MDIEAPTILHEKTDLTLSQGETSPDSNYCYTKGKAGTKDFVYYRQNESRDFIANFKFIRETDKRHDKNGRLCCFWGPRGDFEAKLLHHSGLL